MRRSNMTNSSQEECTSKVSINNQTNHIVQQASENYLQEPIIQSTTTYPTPSTTTNNESFDLAKHLTIIVTTSPIKSNPSTELLEKTFDTFHYGGYDFAYKCPKVIICDGCRIKPDEEGDQDGHEESINTNSDDGVTDGGKIKTNNNNAEDTTIVTGQQKKQKYTSIQSNNTNDEKRKKQKPPTVSRKYYNVKQSLRNGIATSTQAENYRLFKEKLKLKCQVASSSSSSLDYTTNPSPFQNTRVVELEQRHGYGFALKHALNHEVDTPYVCVIQHDRTFIRSAPISEVVQTMMNEHPSPTQKNGINLTTHDGTAKQSATTTMQQVKYVGLSMRSNILYRDHFLSKYGREWYDQLLNMVLTPSELRLSAKEYGISYDCNENDFRDTKSEDNPLPSGNDSTYQMLQKFPFLRSKVRENMIAIAQNYKRSMQHYSHIEMMKSRHSPSIDNRNTNGDDILHQLSLTPTIFWYDNTHIVETKHYRDFIFKPRNKMVARGGFVEDRLSPIMAQHVKKGIQEGKGFREGFSKFGCYLLDDHSGFYFTGHLDGGAYITDQERKEIEANKAS